LLAGAAASFECFNRSRYQEGAHVIFVGQVERCSRREGAAPLLHHGSKCYTEHPIQSLCQSGFKAFLSMKRLLPNSCGDKQPVNL